MDLIIGILALITLWAILGLLVYIIVRGGTEGDHPKPEASHGNGREWPPRR